MSAKELSVRFAESLEERTGVALRFVSPLYLKAYATAPPLADVYAVVEGDGQIRACLGIEWPDTNGLLGIERAYDMDPDAYLKPLTKENKLQFGRWASVAPKAGMLAVYAGTSYGLSHGRSYALVEHNMFVHRRAVLLGIPFYELPHLPLDLTKIREENRDFYAKRDMKPYLMDLKETEKALRLKVSSIASIEI